MYQTQFINNNLNKKYKIFQIKINKQLNLKLKKNINI